MKCYEFSHEGVLTEGLAIAALKDAPVVRIFGEHRLLRAMPPLQVVRIAGALAQWYQSVANHPLSAFIVGNIRLKNCDVEKRSEFWLTPETPETANHALVMCTGLGFLKQISYSVSGSGAECLGATGVTFPNGIITGYTILAKLPPGGEIKFEAAGLIRRAMRRKKRTITHLQVQPDGTIKVLSFKKMV